MSPESQSIRSSNQTSPKTTDVFLLCSLLLVALTMAAAFLGGMTGPATATQTLPWVAGLGFAAVVCALVSIRQALESKQSG